MKKISVFPFHDTTALTIYFFENWFLWWLIESVRTNVWFPALCTNRVILTVCGDFQCKNLSFTVATEKLRYSTLRLCLALAFTANVRILLNGWRERCTDIRDTPVIRVAFVSSRFIILWLTKAVVLQPDFRLSSRSSVLAIGGASVTKLRKNPNDASVIPFLIICPMH